MGNHISRDGGNMKFKFLSVSLMVIAFSQSAFVFATDQQVVDGLKKARDSFSQRSKSNPAPIEDALATLASLEGKADNVDLNYDVLILEARALYWKGAHTANSHDRMEIHEQGRLKAEKATQIDEGYADSYYFYGINLARWAEANGVIASLSRKGELMKAMNDAIEHEVKPAVGSEEMVPGTRIDGNGPNRVLGRLYFKLPGLFGGSQSESLRHLKKAYDEAKNVALNSVYYAETLNGGDRSERELAKKILADLLKENPATYNADRTPETFEEFELAKQLLDQIK